MLFINIALAFIDEAEDKDLFVDLYEQHRIALLGYAHSILKHTAPDAAEDAVQEAYISIAKHIETVRRIPPAKRVSFLTCTVRNKCIDLLRRHARSSNTPLDDVSAVLPDDDPSPIDMLISDEGYSFLKDCIDAVGDTYRDVLELRLVYDLGDTEIASLLGITPNSVSVRLCRGKAKLRELVRNGGSER